MMDNVRPIPWRKVVYAISAALIVVNLAVAIWYGSAEKKLQQLREELKQRTSQNGELQMEVIRLSAQVEKRYDAEVKDYRTLEAITWLVRDREDFPVATGDHIVSWVTQVPTRHFGAAKNASEEENRIRVLFYVPPGKHRLRYSFKELWDREEFKHFDTGANHLSAHHQYWEANAVSLEDLPTAIVHEIEFLVEQAGEETVLQVSVADHHQRSFTLRPCKVLGHRAENRFHSFFPNQHLSPSDETNHSASVWKRSETVLNELLYHGMRTESLRKDEQTYEKYSKGGFDRQRPRQGALILRCWIESDVPVSASALTAAAHSYKFLRRYMRDGKHTEDGPVPNVDELFQAYDGSGNLYYRIPPQAD